MSELKHPWPPPPPPAGNLWSSNQIEVRAPPDATTTTRRPMAEVELRISQLIDVAGDEGYLCNVYSGNKKIRAASDALLRAIEALPARPSSEPGERARALEEVERLVIDYGAAVIAIHRDGPAQQRAASPEVMAAGRDARAALLAAIRSLASAPASSHGAPPSCLADAALLVRKTNPEIATQLDALIRSWPRASSPGAEEGLRPEVLAFARVMSAKIDGHNHDRGEYGWRDAKPGHLVEWLRRYYGGLLTSVADGAPAEVVASKAANVANLAMMIADVCGALAGRADGKGTT